MSSLIHNLDTIAGINCKGIAAILERASFVFFLLMILMAPHTIAGTQIAWLTGMLFWIIRHFIRPYPNSKATFLAIPILALYVWTVVSSFMSYAPDISMGKTRGAALFFIFFYGFNQLRTRKAAKLAAAALIFSCMVNVLWMPLERLIGKGIKIERVEIDGPLHRAGFRDGYNLFKANDKRLRTPADLVEEIERSGVAEIRYYFDGHYWQWKVAKQDLLPGDSPIEKLGIGGWSKSRSWRSSGFYGHYATYAEVVQLIGSLTFGILIAAFALFLSNRNRKDTTDETDYDTSNLKPLGLGLGKWSILLACCFGLISLALLLTITRAAQLGFLVSVFVIVLAGGGRRMLIALLVLSVPAIFAGVIFIQQTRGLESLAGSDSSTTWRLNVYREGIELWTKNARNFTFGVGMDSIKRYASEWRLFQEGGFGHFHSTPVQLLVERGFPALIFWIWIFGAYIWALIRAIRLDNFRDWNEKGIVLGALGGCVGFLVSSLVHYNYGDEEVLMLLYVIMAISMTLVTSTSGKTPQAVPAHPQ